MPPFYKSLLIPNIENVSATKKGNSDGSMGSKSKTEIMESYEINKREAETKLKKQKKENALDIISKSLQKNINANRPKGSDGILILIFSIMSTLKNKVQLIGNVGNAPETKTLESGKKVANFSLATNEFYKNSEGEKVQNTQWHNIVAWGKIAEIVEKYVGKGKEVAIEGKLTSRSYETETGEKRYVTEVVADEILLLGTKDNTNAE